MTERVSEADGVGGKRILVVGAARQLFWDYDTSVKSNLVVHQDVLEGIHAAAASPFDTVALEVRLAGGKLPSVLKSLREHTTARLVLLTQMVEEPIARRQTLASGAFRARADDYLICPASLAWLTGQTGELLNSSKATGADEVRSSVVVEQRLRQLERLATEDDLTGLKNRRYVWEFSRQILEHATEQQGRVTLLVYDIDDFKQYNDRYGHGVGDRILTEAAILMRRCCRSHDVVGRIGGDEFAVVFWDDPQEVAEDESERRTAQVQHPREVMFIAQRFQVALKNSDLRGLGSDGQGVLTISGGLASYPHDGITVQQLFEKADRALLEAKRSGKNRIYLVGQPPE